MRNINDDSDKDPEWDEFGETDADDSSDDNGSDHHSPRRRKRKRIKIRKRVRLKRKSSPKKKFRKILEIAAWTLIFIAFIVALVVLITELDLNEKNRKKRTSYLLTNPAIECTEIHADDLTNTISVCYLIDGSKIIPDPKKLF